MNSDLILSRVFMETHPSDAARLIETFPPSGAVEILRQMPPETVTSPVLQCMDLASASECLACWPDEHGQAVMSALPLHYLVSLLRRMDEKDRKRLLQLLSEHESRPIHSMLRYPENTAGALMYPKSLVLPDDIDAQEARTRVQARLAEAHFYIFVVSRDDKLVGVTNLRELMLAEPDKPLSRLMQRKVSKIPARAVKEAIISNPGWQLYHTLPVVDKSGVFLGVIGYETMRKLEQDRVKQKPADGFTTAMALGELYWVGASSVVSTLTSLLKENTHNKKNKEG